MTSPDPFDFTPDVFADGQTGGTAITSVKLNKVETAVDVALSALSDATAAIASLQSALPKSIGYTRGTTFPAPTLDSPLFLNQADHKLYSPQGTGWYDAMGNAASTAGASNAPQNFTAVVNPDNTITTTWSAVSGATNYSVADALGSPITGMPVTTTSYTRPASSATATLELYVTCTVGGVTSAQSNHVTVYLPYGSSGSSSTGSATPASILNIGTGSAQNHFSLDIGVAGGSDVVHTMSEIVNGFTSAGYFTVNAAGNAVAMQCYANSGTTSGSPHPRTELREVEKDGTTKAAWSQSGSHKMMWTARITHVPADSESSGNPKPWTCWGQIHDDKGDVVRMQVEGSSASSLKLVSRTHSPNGAASSEVATTIASSYATGTAINAMIDVENGTCNIWLGGTITWSGGVATYTGGSIVKSTTISGSQFYYKVGDYQQFTTGSSDGAYGQKSYATVEISNLYVVHSPALS